MNKKNNTDPFCKLETLHWPYLSKFLTFSTYFALSDIYRGVCLGGQKSKILKIYFLLTSHLRTIWKIKRLSDSLGTVSDEDLPFRQEFSASNISHVFYF